MPLGIKRPDSSFDPARGLMSAEHFQMAYATNDIDRACEIFSERLGIREFRRLEGQLPAGGQIRIELAWVGTIMYELLTASGPGSDFFVGRLPAEGFAIRHHHLGYLIRDEAEWRALLAEIERQGRTPTSTSDNPGFMKVCYIDAPELGHYLEYLYPEPAGLAFFESVPGN